jgi:hypothetical protein
MCESNWFIVEYSLKLFVCIISGTDICSDSNVNNWSYFLTNSKEHGRAPIFQDPLEFPKISLTSDKIIGTQLTNIHEKIQEKNKISFF